MESFSRDQITKIRDLKIPSLRRYSSRDQPQVICARVTWVQDIKDSGKGNKYAKFLLRDDTGMIDAVAVGDADSFQTKLDLLKVYLLSNFSLRRVDNRYSNPNKFYCIYLNTETTVQLVQDINRQPQEAFYRVDDLMKYFQTLKDSQWIDVVGKVLQPGEDENGRKTVWIGSSNSDTGLSLRLWGKLAKANYATGEYLALRQILFQRKDGSPTLSSLERTHIQRCGRKHEPKVHFVQGEFNNVQSKSNNNTDSQRREVENKDAKFGRLLETPLLAKLYLEALETGEEESNAIRVIVVGHNGAGKTTLVKKLLGSPTSEEPHDSTEGIEIHVHKCAADKDGTWIPVTESDWNNSWMERIASNSSSLSTDSRVSAHSGPQTMEIDGENTGIFESPIADKIQKNSSNTKNVHFEEKDEGKIGVSASYAHHLDSNLSEHSELSGVSLLEFKNALGKCKKHERKNISIWDFAGQYIFYATHQLFLSSEAVYLLVVDLSKELNAEIHEEQGTALKTVSDFCEFWIHSIYTFATTERGPPPVFLVGTHSDYFDNFEKARTACDKLLDAINTSSCISKQFITGDSRNGTSVVLDETENLRKAIVKISSLQPWSAMKIPKRWIPLEKQLMKQKEEGRTKYLAVEDVWNLNTKSDKPLKTMDDIQAFLSYHHNLGNLVYFSEKGLSDWVVIDPKWIIDAFASIITTRSFFEKRSLKRLNSLWEKVIDTATINENDLFEGVWKSIPEFYENRKWLLQVMQKLHMIARLHSFDDKTNRLTEQDTFIIPSFLANRRCNDSDINDIYKLKEGTDILSFHLEKSLVPPTVFHDLVATAIHKWQPYEKRKKKHLLFESIAVFKLDTAHIGIIERHPMSIDISVKSLCEKRIDAKLCDQFRRNTESVLKTKPGYFPVEKDDTYKIQVKCGKQHNQNDDLIYHDFHDLKTTEQVVCLACDSPHVISCDEVMRQWFTSEDWVYGFSKYLPNERKDSYVKEEELLDIGNTIRDNWEILAGCLGFKKTEIDRIANDSKNYREICIWNMLQACLKKEIEMTWGRLILEVDRACEYGLTVDSDSLRDCLEKLQ